jgi:hypothetical protein
LRQLTEAELKVINDVADMLMDLIEDEIRETEAEAIWCAVWGRVTQKVAVFARRRRSWHTTLPGTRVEATDGPPLPSLPWD